MNYEDSQSILETSVEELKTHQRENRNFRIIGVVRLIYIAILSTSIISSLVQTFYKTQTDKIRFISVLIVMMIAYSLVYTLSIIYNVKQLVEEIRLTGNILHHKKFRLISIILYCVHLIYILYTLNEIIKTDNLILKILCCIYFVCLVVILFVDFSLFKKNRILIKLN